MFLRGGGWIKSSLLFQEQACTQPFEVSDHHWTTHNIFCAHHRRLIIYLSDMVRKEAASTIRYAGMIASTATKKMIVVVGRQQCHRNVLYHVFRSAEKLLLCCNSFVHLSTRWCPRPLVLGGGAGGVAPHASLSAGIYGPQAGPYKEADIFCLFHKPFDSNNR